MAFAFAPSSQQLPITFKPIGPDSRPNAYETVSNPQMQFTDQGNGLTSPQWVTPEAAVRILDKNQQLNGHWTQVAGGAGPMEVDPPVQIEGSRVRVSEVDQGKALLKNDHGHITGNPEVLQAYTGAEQAVDWANRQLGRNVSFTGNQKKLNVLLHNPKGAEDGPHSETGKATVSLPGDEGAVDPDVMHHETGHAILDGARPEMKGGDVHEGFGDGTALFTALENKDVRADVLDKLHHGQRSNLASNIAEGYEQTQGEDGKKPPVRQGLRDLSAAPPKTDTGDPHENSRQMTSAAYNSVLDKFGELKKANPHANEDDLLKQAGQSVGHDFARAVDFLPVGSDTTQGDFAHAMIKANKNDQGGNNAALYEKNFKAAGLKTTSEYYDNKEADLSKFRQDPKMTAPASLTGAKDFRTTTGQAAPATTRAAADQYLQQHSKALGIFGKGYHATELYHNDRGETYIHYSTGKDRDDTSNGTRAEVAFDKDGKLIDYHEREMINPMMAFPMGPQ